MLYGSQDGYPTVVVSKSRPVVTKVRTLLEREATAIVRNLRRKDFSPMLLLAVADTPR